MNVGKVLSGPAGYGVAILAGGIVLYLMWDKIGTAAKAAAEGVGGIATGNNAVTDAARTDAYKGAGIAGTVGAAVDNAAGGVFSRIGESLGGWFYEKTHPQAAATASNKTAVSDNFWAAQWY